MTLWGSRAVNKDTLGWVDGVALASEENKDHVQILVWGSDWVQKEKRERIIETATLLAKERHATVFLMRDPTIHSPAMNSAPTCLGAILPDGSTLVGFWGA